MARIIPFLRSLLFVLLMIVATVIWAFACFLFAPLPYNKRYYWTSRWNMFVVWTAKVICGIRYQIKGVENLQDAPMILLSKHQSAWETIFYLYYMPRPLVYVFKKELTYIPFFGWGIALLRMIPIDRSGSSCSRKARAYRLARPAATRVAVRVSRLKPTRRCCRLRSTPANAGQRIPSSRSQA